MNAQFLTGLLIKLPVLFFSITFHEFWHAFSAYLLGDTTARDENRLSLNPLDHLDPVGTLCMIFGFFGWAKPVPINPYNTRHPERTMMITALAGPLSNLTLAAVLALLLRLLLALDAVPAAWTAWSPETPIWTRVLCHMFALGIALNVVLAVFNLLPLNPLDGHHILRYFLPHRWKAMFWWLNQYGIYVLLALIALPLFTPYNPLWTILYWPQRTVTWLVAGSAGQQWVDAWFSSFFHFFGRIALTTR